MKYKNIYNQKKKKIIKSNKAKEKKNCKKNCNRKTVKITSKCARDGVFSFKITRVKGQLATIVVLVVVLVVQVIVFFQQQQQ